MRRICSVIAIAQTFALGFAVEQCPKGMEFNECDTPCPLVCGEPEQMMCIEMCVSRCACPKNAPWMDQTDSSCYETEYHCPDSGGLGSSCATDDDCDEGFCRPTTNDWTSDAVKKVCVAFSLEGEGCGGFTLPSWQRRCGPNHECVEYGGPFLADAPGVCARPCGEKSPGRDAWGHCVDAGCIAWFDGCNICEDMEGSSWRSWSCAEKACYDSDALGEAECKDEDLTMESCCQRGGESYYDGCNTCDCDTDACTLVYCVWEGIPSCNGADACAAVSCAYAECPDGSPAPVPEDGCCGDASLCPREDEGAPCTLGGGEVVVDGWSGKDTGATNYCNSCHCFEGALGCTRMGCPQLQLQDETADPCAGLKGKHKRQCDDCQAFACDAIAVKKERRTCKKKAKKLKKKVKRCLRKGYITDNE